MSDYCYSLIELGCTSLVNHNSVLFMLRNKTDSVVFTLCGKCIFHIPECSVTDPDPEGSETFAQIRTGSEIYISDPDSIPDLIRAFISFQKTRIELSC